MKCQICLRDFKKLRFCTSRIKICGRCVRSLNENHQVAERSVAVFAENLRFAIERRHQATIDSADAPEWTIRKALDSLENIDSELRTALPIWINKNR